MARVSAIVAALLFACVPAAARALDDVHWLAPGVDRVAALTHAPAECLAMPADPEQAWRVALGRVAFRSPVLLGGLAARAGMSCNTCHRNGHGNAEFFVDGFSGAPGTADVTSSLFSKTRGDDTFNPVPIPDITGVSGKARFGTMRPADDLPSFVHSVMVEEFQGREPIPAVSDGIVAYVAALKPAACPAEDTTILTFDGAVDEMDGIYAVLLDAIDRGDLRAADFVLLSLNAALGRLAQRFPDAAESRSVLPGLGHDLNAIRPLLAADSDGARRSLAGWRARLDRALAGLAAKQSTSLYDPEALARWLARPDGQLGR